MKKIIVTIAAVTVLATFLTGCIEVKSPQVEYDSYKVTALDLEKTNINFKLNMTNPNPIGVEDSSYSYQLYIFDKLLLEQDNIPLNLPANKTIQTVIPVEIKFLQVFNTAAEMTSQILAGKKEIPYKLKGVVKAKFFAISFDIPYENSGNIPLPEVKQKEINKVLNEGLNQLKNLF